MGKPGRPPNPIDPAASAAAKLGAELRRLRTDRGLTQAELGVKVGYSAQHVSGTELAKTPVSGLFIAACDKALDAEGALMALMDAVVLEQAALRYERSAARDGLLSALPYGAATDAGEDVDPTNRRGLIEASAAATLGGLGVAVAPAAARDVDPALVEHFMTLMQLLDRHGGAFGPHDVLPVVRRELRLIAEHRQVARGPLRTDLQRVESRWSQFAGWLSNDAGDRYRRDAWADRAQRLAEEAEYPEMVAYVLQRRSRWAIEDGDAQRATAFAEAARRVRKTTPRMRALCALKLAHGHALAGNAAGCTSSLRDADALLADGGTPRPDPLGIVTRHEVSWPYVKADIARCRLWLKPAEAVTAFEEVLRIWPSGRTRDRGVQQARLALACASANALDRAAAEGMKALDIAHTTRSHVTMHELKRLERRLASCDVPAAAEFRQALAVL